MSSDSDDDSSHLSKILNNDFVNSLNLKPEPPQLHMRNATRSVSEKKVSMSQDEDDVLIHVLRQHLGMELSTTGCRERIMATPLRLKIESAVAETKPNAT